MADVLTTVGTFAFRARFERSPERVSGAVRRVRNSGVRLTRRWSNRIRTLGPRCARRTSLRIMRRRFDDPGSGCRMVLVCRGRCRIEFTVALLDPPRADMALHRDADMVWAVAGTCRVKFLSGFAGGQGKNALAQA
jgi:hypothetical protein